MTEADEYDTKVEMVKDSPEYYNIVSVGTLGSLASVYGVECENFWKKVRTDMHKDDVKSLLRSLQVSESEIAADVDHGRIHPQLAEKRISNIRYVVDILKEDS